MITLQARLRRGQDYPHEARFGTIISVSGWEAWCTAVKKLKANKQSLNLPKVK